MSRVAFCFVFDRFILRNAKDCGRTCLCRLYDHRLTAPPHPANDPREVPWNRSALFNSTRTTRMCQEQLALIHCWTHSMLAFILHALLNYHLLPISCALDVYSRNSINPILEKLQWTWEGIQKPWVDQNFRSNELPAQDQEGEGTNPAGTCLGRTSKGRTQALPFTLLCSIVLKRIY